MRVGFEADVIQFNCVSVYADKKKELKLRNGGLKQQQKIHFFDHQVFKLFLMRFLFCSFCVGVKLAPEIIKKRIECLSAGDFRN